MQDKLDFYDVLGVLVPGVLVICSIPLAFPVVAKAIAETGYPDGFAFVGLTAASIFAGYLIQAIASLLEGLLNRTWGGRPSEVALDHGLGDRFLPASAAARIKQKIAAVAEPDASSRSLFLIAKRAAENSGAPLVQRFNALYAYHRALVVLSAVALVLFVFSFWGGLGARLGWKENTGIILVIIGLLVLFWHRTKQRGMYYVREVLLCAEHNLPASSS